MRQSGEGRPLHPLRLICRRDQLIRHDTRTLSTQPWRIVDTYLNRRHNIDLFEATLASDWILGSHRTLVVHGWIL